MKIKTNCLAVAALLLGAAYTNAAVDIVQNPQPYFVDPVNWQTQYRYWNQDWSWTHGAIAGTPTTASLSISAYDVDWSATSAGEHDIISAYRVSTASWVNLGELGGANNIWAFTTFTLDSSWFTSINAGLQVHIDIDSTHTSNVWAVSLAKSVITTDGSGLPDPNPGVVPEPSTYVAGALMLLPFGASALRIIRKNRKA